MITTVSCCEIKKGQTKSNPCPSIFNHHTVSAFRKPSDSRVQAGRISSVLVAFVRMPAGDFSDRTTLSSPYTAGSWYHHTSCRLPVRISCRLAGLYVVMRSVLAARGPLYPSCSAIKELADRILVHSRPTAIRWKRIKVGILLDHCRLYVYLSFRLPDRRYNFKQQYLNGLRQREQQICRLSSLCIVTAFDTEQSRVCG